MDIFAVVIKIAKQRNGSNLCNNFVTLIGVLDSGNVFVCLCDCGFVCGCICLYMCVYFMCSSGGCHYKYNSNITERNQSKSL